MKWYYYILLAFCALLCSCNAQKNSVKTSHLKQQVLESFSLNTVSRDSIYANGVLMVKIKRVTETMEMDTLSHKPFVKTREIENIELTEKNDVSVVSDTESQATDTISSDTEENILQESNMKYEDIGTSKIFKGIGGGILAAMLVFAISIGITFFVRYKKR